MDGGITGILQAGGPIIAILIVLSLISLTLIAVKFVQLQPVKSGGTARVAALALWAGGDRAGAQAALQEGRAPADRVTAAAMAAIARGNPRPVVEAEAARIGNDEVGAMNRYIRALEMIAMISPLLGLLGTVLGMIESFQQLDLAEGAANASVLAGGIWRALLTTAAGLMVAIPAAAAAALYAARIDSAALMIESTIGRLMHIEYGRPEAPAAPTAA